MRIKIVYIIFSLLALGFVFGCPKAGHKTHEVHWGYEGQGAPEHWGALKPDFALCGTGTTQSPIDIDETKIAELEDIEFSYKEAPLKIINNGHAIQVNCEPGSSAVIDGKTYDLLQYHFHAPSEHTVKGNFYDMELHFVHKNELGELAVVGLFLEKGEKNQIIEVLWDNIPKDIGKENVVSETKVDASALLPKDKNYFHYIGSLTTPPCTEDVNWNVLKTPIGVSAQQIEKLRSIMGVDTNRPVQPINNRTVLASE